MPARRSDGCVAFAPFFTPASHYDSHPSPHPSPHLHPHLGNINALKTTDRRNSSTTIRFHSLQAQPHLLDALDALRSADDDSLPAARALAPLAPLLRAYDPRVRLLALSLFERMPLPTEEVRAAAVH